MTFKRDWSDVLSPVVVKEVRQGVRGKVFVGAFLITQVLMVFSVFLSMSLIANQDDTRGATTFFWTLVALPLVIIMPARGLQAVGSEIRDETIDLVFLSKLSAWRIIFGKWTALSAQSVLMVSSLLPYIVLRYFIGSVNLLQELLILGLVLLASMLLCAASVSLSAFQPKGKKGGNMASGFIILFLVVFVGPSLPFMLFGVARSAGRGGISATDFLNIYLSAIFLGPLLAVFLMQFGASKIAPAAENHALRKRLTAVLAFTAAATLSYFEVARPLPFLFACGLLAITVIDAVCEPIPQIYSIYLPFVKRGSFGSLIGRALYPGWASGSIFAFLAVTAVFGWGALHPDVSRDLEWNAYLATLGIIFFPLALIRFFKPDLERPLAAYCAIQAITAVVTSVAVIISEVLDNDILSMVLSVIPLSYVIVEANNVREAKAIFYVGGSALLLTCMLILLWRIRGAFTQTDAMLREFAASAMVGSEPELDADVALSPTALPPQVLSSESGSKARPVGGVVAPPPLPQRDEDGQ